MREGSLYFLCLLNPIPKKPMAKTGTTIYVSAETMDIINDVHMCMQADTGVKVTRDAAINAGLEIIRDIYLKRMAGKAAKSGNPNYILDRIRNAK